MNDDSIFTHDAWKCIGFDRNINKTNFIAMDVSVLNVTKVRDEEEYEQSIHVRCLFIFIKFYFIIHKLLEKLQFFSKEIMSYKHHASLLCTSSF